MAATAFVDIHAYSNKIFCFEVQLVQHPLHRTSGFIHEHANFSWNIKDAGFDETVLSFQPATEIPTTYIL